MCPQMKRLHYVCKQMKRAQKLHYYTFFNGSLRVQVQESDGQKYVGHISDLVKLTGMERGDIEKLAPHREWLPVVLNRNMLERGWQMQPQYTYIGRPGFWGNPNKLSVFNNRSDCIVEYEKYARSSPDILARLPELSSKYIVCNCHPLECHGDVLVKLFREIVLTPS